MAPERSEAPHYPSTEGMSLADIFKSKDHTILVADVGETFNQSAGRIPSLPIKDIRTQFPSWYDLMMKMAENGFEGCRIEGETWIAPRW